MAQPDPESRVERGHHDQAEDQWKNTFGPIAQHIVYAAIHFLPFIYHQANFVGKAGADWLYLLMFGIVLVVVVAFFPSIVALVFSNKLSAKWRCRLVQLSLVGLMLGIALALITVVMICRATARSPVVN